MKIRPSGTIVFATFCILSRLRWLPLSRDAGIPSPANAGTVTQGSETPVGLGALDGNFVFGATLAGFDATPDNVAHLVCLARAKNAAIDAATGQ